MYKIGLKIFCNKKEINIFGYCSSFKNERYGTIVIFIIK